MNCCAVIDTNVLVSALLSSHDDAATVQVVGRLLAGEIVSVYSNAIFREYQEVLNRKKFRFEPQRIAYLLSAISKFGILIEPASTGMVLPDMKDLPFYEIVMDTREDNSYLVTENTKHFPKEPFIVTARQLLDILDGRKQDT